MRQEHATIRSLRAASRWAARLAVAALALLLALTGLALPVSATPAPVIAPTTTRVDEPVIVVSLGGMRWRDVNPAATPNLLRLLQTPNAAAGSLVVRSVATLTCPVDGWLTLSAGRRAIGAPRGTPCESIATHRLPARVTDWATYIQTAADLDYGAAPGTLGQALADSNVPTAALGPGGVLALTLPDGNLAAPQAALPDPLQPADISGALPQLLRDGSRVIVIDPASKIDDITRLGSGAGPHPPVVDSRITHSLDTALGAVLDAAGAHAEETGQGVRIIAAGLHDRHARPFLHVVATARITGDLPPASPAPPTGPLDTAATTAAAGAKNSALPPTPIYEIASASTRQPALAQTTDLLPTILSQLSRPTPTSAVGTPITIDTSARYDLADFIASQADTDTHIDRSRAAVPFFYPGYILLVLTLFAASMRLLRRPRAAEASPRRHRLCSLWAGTALALPLGVYLIDALPWWRAPAPIAPVLALVGALIIGVFLSAGALAARRLVTMPDGAPAADVPARLAAARWAFAPAVLAVALWITLIVDVVRGSPIQRTAVMGSFATVGGRFYGMNNTSFVLLTVTSFIAAAALAGLVPRAARHARLARASIIAAVGLMSVVIDGTPSLGADFGGPPALIPGFAIATLLAAGIRLSWRRILAIGLATVAAVTAITFLDYLRPPANRTHLGRFAQSIVDGEVWQIIGRKAGANLAILTSSYFTILLLAALIVLALFLRNSATRKTLAHRIPFLARRRTVPADAASAPGSNNEIQPPYAWLLTNPDSLLARLPLIRPAAYGIAAALTLGFALNDSGVVIPAIGLGLAVPAFLMIAHAAAPDLSEQDEEIRP